ncbi:MAG: hypothetical protein ACQEQL_02885 [Pseudomonadota bacterium]
MKNYNEILRSGLAAVFMSAAANSALGQEPENNDFVDSVLAGQEQSSPGQARPGTLSFVYKPSTLSPDDGGTALKFADWQKRERKEPPLPEPEPLSETSADYPVLNGQNIGADFNMVRRFVTRLADEGMERTELLNIIAAYSADLSRNYYKADSPENDLIIRPDIYGHDDDWETLREVILENGDDCEGLAMLTRQLMTDIGIPKNETFLSVMRPLSDDHPFHMVVMWVDSAHPHDPLLIDSTGYISDQPYRASWAYTEGGENGKYFATHRLNEDGLHHIAHIPGSNPKPAPTKPASKR